ncbi:MAG TPA: thiamine pyrophosphate-dependent enzyme [Chloroflexota bacterium]|jgi:2-oxoisovalerate dehydrogenase E1 component|nr:thiamine pyrophosphate-dependent enzyme [Chloroflexota bacterium]
MESVPTTTPGQLRFSPNGSHAAAVPTAASAPVGDRDLLAMYRTMRLARLVDERLWILNRQGKLLFTVSCQGHEAIGVALAQVLRPGEDWVAPYYRDLALMIGLGATPDEVFLHALAKADDPCSGGRQMPAHWSFPRLRVMTTSSVTGTQTLHAVGAALVSKLRREPTVAVTTLGEGATSQGEFHEACNFAAVKRLPVVFVVETNGWAISEPISEQMAVSSVAARAAAYGFPGIDVDGTDTIALVRAFSAAVERARAGEGPTLINAECVRLTPHTSDDQETAYRNVDDIQCAKECDPLLIAYDELVGRGVWSDEQDKKLVAELRAEVEPALERAMAAPEPDRSTLERHVYAATQSAPPAAGVQDAERPASGDRGGAPDAVAEGDGSPFGRRTGATSMRWGGAGAADAATVAPTGPGAESGKPGAPPTYLQAIREALIEELRADERVIVFGEDIGGTKGGVFKVTEGLPQMFGDDRVFNSPLAEASIVGVAIGAAMAGFRPVIEIQFADFIFPAMNQIINEAAKLRYRSNGGYACPLVIRVPYGGGIHGALYHSQSPECYFAHTPGLKVLVPGAPADAKCLLKHAIRDEDPVLFFEHKKLYRSLREPIGDLSRCPPIGRARVVRAGDALSLFAYGYYLRLGLQAAERVAEKHGRQVEVVDLRSLVPLDRETIRASVERTNRAVVLYEANRSYGPGAEVAAFIAEECFEHLDAPVVRVASPDVPAIPFNGRLEEAYLVSVERLVEAIEKQLAY